jgi:putative endonuclease
MCFVYILRSLKNNRYYIGSTNDIKRRLVEHNSGRSRYDKINSPYELVFNQEYSTPLLARRTELWLKKQKSKILITRIIREGKINKILSGSAARADSV